ncbi:MAG: ABC transporter permease [Azoarcus sp.]|jgi:sulfonate transport system permease protein|nr:ABC transporter permease [Azoarcus sp.]
MNTQTLSTSLPLVAADTGKTPNKALARAGEVVARFSLGVLAPLAILALWQLASAYEWIPVQILPSPRQTWETFLDLTARGELGEHLSISLARVSWSVLAGGSIGLALGFAIGLSARTKAYLHPSFEVFAQFPVIGWIPLLMLFLGIDEALKIAAISFAVVVPVTVNTYKGILAIPRDLLEVGRVYAFTSRQTLLRVVVPSALPSIFSGIRQGIMQAWLALIFVELLASSEGLGYLMTWARQVMQLDIVFVLIVVVGLVGFALDWVLQKTEKHFLAWNPKGL